MARLSIISTVRAPVSDLLAFVDFHLAQGFDHIILFFDDPEDPAVEELASKREVTCVKCTDAYWHPYGQRPKTVEERFIANLNDGVPIAIRNGCSWIAHIDSDELVYPVSQLRPLIDDSEVDAIRFTVMEAVPESDVDDSVFATNLFKRLSSAELISQASSQGVSTAFFQGEYFRGHSASKTLIKISPKII